MFLINYYQLYKSPKFESSVNNNYYKNQNYNNINHLLNEQRTKIINNNQYNYTYQLNYINNNFQNNNFQNNDSDSEYSSESDSDSYKTLDSVDKIEFISNIDSNSDSNSDSNIDFDLISEWDSDSDITILEEKNNNIDQIDIIYNNNEYNNEDNNKDNNKDNKYKYKNYKIRFRKKNLYKKYSYLNYPFFHNNI
jgi:hypothetical protein